jgi:hypothetical protein
MWGPHEIKSAVCSLFKDAFSTYAYIGSNDRMAVNNELERCGMKRLWANLRFYPAIFWLRMGTR